MPTLVLGGSLRPTVQEKRRSHDDRCLLEMDRVSRDHRLGFEVVKDRTNEARLEPELRTGRIETIYVVDCQPALLPQADGLDFSFDLLGLHG